MEKITQFETRLLAAFEEVCQSSSNLLPLNNNDENNTTEYDIESAAEVFAAIFQQQRPREVLREHGLLDLDVDSSEISSNSSCVYKRDLDGKIIFFLNQIVI